MHEGQPDFPTPESRPEINPLFGTLNVSKMKTTRFFPTKIAQFLLVYVLFSVWNPASAQFMDRRTQLRLDDMIRESMVFSQIFTGFALYDPAKEVMLYQKDAYKFFTPASNTKLFTLYTILKVLGDSMPVLRYGYKDGLLVVQGTGNPLFLHPDFPQDPAVWNILSQAKGVLFFSDDNYKDDHFGPGWSWADYQYAYQVEKSAMPLYGNFTRFQRDTIQPEQLQIIPEFFRGYLSLDTAMTNGRPRIRREEHGDRFFGNPRVFAPQPFSSDVPFNSHESMICSLLADTLNLLVLPADRLQGPLPPMTTLYAPLPDTLLRRFMQQSDNFLAEQLLLMCSEKLFGNLNTEQVIDYAKANIFTGMPDSLNWADGSGLSRYNLFTPRTIVNLLNRYYKEMPTERLFSILPAGGVSGTIQSWYGGKEEPYVFAKTGSLANQHCLSGCVKTKKGRVLIFSFMHNNFTMPGNEVRNEMQKVLESIWTTL